MPLIKSFHHKTNLKIKVIASLCSIILLAFFVSGYIAYTMHIRIAKEEVGDQFVQTVDRILYSIDRRAEGSAKLSDQIVFHPVISGIVQSNSQGAVKAETERYNDSIAVTDILNQMMLVDPQLLSINLFDMQGGQYRALSSFLMQPLSSKAFDMLGSKLEQSDGELVWFRASLDELLPKASVEADTIVAARWMKDEKLSRFGLLVFVFHERYFMNELQHISSNDEDQFYLFNRSGELLYTDASDMDLYKTADMMESELRTQRNTGKGNNYIDARSVSESTSLTLFSRTSMEGLESKSAIIFQISLYSGLISIVLSGILLIVIMKRLFHPLGKLVEGMRKVRSGKLDTQIQIKTNDELAFLSESFNSMVDNINVLIREVYEKQLRAKEAELSALQSQLNPHFLYNTLDMLYWKLYMRDDETASLIVSLSEMLRYSLEPMDAETTVKDEIYQLNNYLAIQQSRFEDRLEFEIEVAPDVLNCRIIPLLLQPLVENVFVHAFKRNGDKPNNVWIGARRHGEYLMIEIKDNGIGMSPDAMDQIARLDYKEGQGKGIGIRSVIRRIELVYGSPYGLDIQSKAGLGTALTLRLPARYATEQEDKEAEL